MFKALKARATKATNDQSAPSSHHPALRFRRHPVTIAPEPQNIVVHAQSIGSESGSINDEPQNIVRERQSITDKPGAVAIALNCYRLNP